MFVFTDGGCIGNGKANAKASYAVYIGDIIIRGSVMPYEYSYNSNILTCTDKKISPSNNRGELLSLVRAFMEILKKDEVEYIVYSDSQICVKTINEWYTNRLRKGTVHEFKNLDLVEIMMSLYNKIRVDKKITIVHTRGHQKITGNMSDHQKKIINGNDIVDRYASGVLQREELIDYEFIQL